MNVSNLNDIEIKALIYDLMIEIKKIQNNIGVLEEELKKRSQQKNKE
jgi:hypothetical protein